MFNLNDSITKKETRGKYIFWDIDGTLAPYRFNNHVADPKDTENGMSLEEIEKGIFLDRKPSKHMQKVIETCEAKKNIIMGHVQNQKEIDDKQKWLDKYYPTIDERILIYLDESKADSIIGYCNSNNISLDEVLFVDDVLKFLKEAEKKGIQSWHISSFLDWNYQ